MTLLAFNDVARIIMGFVLPVASLLGHVKGRAPVNAPAPVTSRSNIITIASSHEEINGYDNQRSHSIPAITRKLWPIIVKIVIFLYLI